MNEWKTVFEEALSALGSQSAALAPKLLISVMILAFGLAISYVAQFVVRNILKKSGIDRFMDRTGLGRMFERMGYEYPISHLSGFFTFWAVLALFLLTSADSLGLPGVSSTIGGIIALLPTVALAMLVLIFGLAIGRTAQRTIEGVAERSRLKAARPVGLAAYYLVAAVSLVIALTRLGFDFTSVTAVVVVILATVGAGLAMTLAMGARDVARNTITGIYTRREIRTGDRIRIGGFEGTVRKSGQVSITVENGSSTYLIPHDLCLSSVVEITGRGADGPSEDR